MRIEGIHRRSIVVCQDGWSIEVIDQRKLPHALVFLRLASLQDVTRAITEMWVRGAPLIGITAVYGLCIALRNKCSLKTLNEAYLSLLSTRPTAVNLRWALDSVCAHLLALPKSQWVEAAYAKAALLCDEDISLCEDIGKHGLTLIRKAAARKPGAPVNILTHCNAGALATMDWGTALAPIYMAHDANIPVHVWVDETRPRNQGMLTAWELGQHGVPHTVIVDNTGGLLMQRAQVDMCIVGADRITANGDVCNKIGTYLKALAAHDNGVPFYVATPYTTLDAGTADGSCIVIEERAKDEIMQAHGQTEEGIVSYAHSWESNTPVFNPAFDVTPARLVSGFITEGGIIGPELFSQYLNAGANDIFLARAG